MHAHTLDSPLALHLSLPQTTTPPMETQSRWFLARILVLAAPPGPTCPCSVHVLIPPSCAILTLGPVSSNPTPVQNFLPRSHALPCCDPALALGPAPPRGPTHFRPCSRLRPHSQPERRPLTPRRRPWKKCTSGCARSGSWHTSSSSERLRPGGITASQRTMAPSGYDSSSSCRVGWQGKLRPRNDGTTKWRRECGPAGQGNFTQLGG